MNKKNATKLAAIILVFILPWALGTVWYATRDWITPPAAKSYGTLLVPPSTIQIFTAHSHKQVAVNSNFFVGKWTLLYTSSGSCDLYCESNLFKMRQVRLALGRDMPRTQRLWLWIPTTNVELPAAILKRYPDLEAATIIESELKAHFPAFDRLAKDSLYIVDPLANIMMVYSRDATSSGILRDLKKLLKISKIG